ncbi:uncharacterized protein LOC127842587 isoform X3 [Dreissena polymorpha]|nr:uncharacterized protein LOC127842587 isoform X3 [Dreissena polymorpha]
MCNFHSQSWIYAMTQCLQLRGTLVGKSTELSLTGLHLNGSFWTADYASWTETAIRLSGSPIECEYRTKGLIIQISQIKSGNCDEMKHYICRDHNMTQPSVKTGTWKEASKCNETYSAAEVVEMTVGDYWLRTAYQNYVFTGYSNRTIDRCGTLYVSGTFQFVSTCFTSLYSFCEVENYSGDYLSECGSTIITKQPSSNNPQTFVSHKTETLTTTTMSINGDTSTESIYRNESSSSLDFKTRTTVQRTTETFTATITSITENTSTDSIVRSQASSSSVQNNTETSTATIMSINGNTSTESVVHNHDSSSSGSALCIGLGVSMSIVVIVLITTVGVHIYKRRYRRKPDNSQVSVHMNALYDVSCQNKTPRKHEHKNESYEYAVPNQLRKNAVNRRAVKGFENEFADLNAYSKAIPRTQRNVNTIDLQSRKATNTGFPSDSTVTKAENAAVMSDEYDDVNSFDAPDPINMNVYSHLGRHDNDDAYDVASYTQTHQSQEGMNDYDRLDKHS